MLQSDQVVEPLGLSINRTAEITGESTWTVKQKLRAGIYKAKKSGRRTLVTFASIRAAWERLPDATFAPRRPRAG